MTQIITRFAPSPTGKLHIGNVRTALINWLITRKYAGEFILRIDDTDLARSKDEYKSSIINDLAWLGLNWDKKFSQSDRLDIYEQAKIKLINEGRLYPCYETEEELEIKRKFQISNGRPPIYDRSALKLSKEQINQNEKAGRKPYYRFLIKDEEIKWTDLIKGEIKYQATHLSDPVIIRTDGSMTYMLCSTVDDVDHKISHVIRGEDHISNTAIQIQIFKALGYNFPIFGHLSLIKTQQDKISKRIGGFDIESLRQVDTIEPMAINSFLAFIGSSQQLRSYKNMKDLINQFDINNYSRTPTTYMPEELSLLNHKLILTYDFEDIENYLKNNGLDKVDKRFWLAIRDNLNNLSEIKEWVEICYNTPRITSKLDKELLSIAFDTLPEKITNLTWKEWTKIISIKTGKKGKELFMPLRIALTGKKTGPELKNLLPLLDRNEILIRLKNYTN